jgi:cell fate (sporulation/competence/biofilm development) regulator YmcA (YheA/YmcA/DUF963 family)
MWRQNWQIDYFDINSTQRSHILRDKLSKWCMVVVFRSNITDSMDILRKITNNDVNNDVMWRQNWQIDYFEINSTQISHILRDKISKWCTVVVFRSNITDFMDILRKITNNDVNNDVMWRQNWQIDYFEINSTQISHILRDKISKCCTVVVFRSNITDFIDILRKMTKSDVINDVIWRRNNFFKKNY